MAPGPHRSPERRGRLRPVAAPSRCRAGPPAGGPRDRPAGGGRHSDMLTGYRRAFNRHDADGGRRPLDRRRRQHGSRLRPAAPRAARPSADIFAALFDVDPRPRIAIDLASIRSLRDDVAVVDGISRVAYEDGAVAGSRFSAVVVRDGNRWLLASVRETATPAESTPAGPLDELAWLVGSWENVGGGVTASSDCSWSGGRRLPCPQPRHRCPTPPTAAAPAAGDTAIPGLLAAAGDRPAGTHRGDRLGSRTADDPLLDLRGSTAGSPRPPGRGTSPAWAGPRRGPGRRHGTLTAMLSLVARRHRRADICRPRARASRTSARRPAVSPAQPGGQAHAGRSTRPACRIPLQALAAGFRVADPWRTASGSWRASRPSAAASRSRPWDRRSPRGCSRSCRRRGCRR